MLRVACEHYKRLWVLRDEIGEIYNTLDESEYFPIDATSRPRDTIPSCSLPPPPFRRSASFMTLMTPSLKKIPVQQASNGIFRRARKRARAQRAVARSDAGGGVW